MPVRKEKSRREKPVYVSGRSRKKGGERVGKKGQRAEKRKGKKVILNLRIQVRLVIAP